MNGEILLSRWWKTESCQRAIERAKAQRQQRINKMRAQLDAHRQEQQRELEQWEEIRP